MRKIDVCLSPYLIHLYDFDIITNKLTTDEILRTVKIKSIDGLIKIYEKK